MSISKNFNIPIQDKEICDKHNAEFETNLKPTEHHIKNMINELYNMISIIGNKGGWYLRDSIKVEIKVEYCPEDK